MWLNVKLLEYMKWNNEGIECSCISTGLSVFASSIRRCIPIPYFPTRPDNPPIFAISEIPGGGAG